MIRMMTQGILEYRVRGTAVRNVDTQNFAAGSLYSSREVCKRYSIVLNYCKIHVKIVESTGRVLRLDTYHGARAHNKFLIISRESQIVPFDIMIFEKMVFFVLTGQTGRKTVISCKFLPVRTFRTLNAILRSTTWTFWNYITNIYIQLISVDANSYSSTVSTIILGIFPIGCGETLRVTVDAEGL
jgi:hypothetical protein